MRNSLVTTTWPKVWAFVIVAGLFTLLSTSVKAETVHDHTYSVSNSSTFDYSVRATHDDNFSPTYSSLHFDLWVTVKDENEFVISESFLSVQLSGGQVDDPWVVEDIGAYITYSKLEDQNTGESEFEANLIFDPTGLVENYTVDVVLVKWVDEDPASLTHNSSFDF